MSDETSAADEEPQPSADATEQVGDNFVGSASGASTEGGAELDPAANPLAPEHPPEHPNAPAPGPGITWPPFSAPNPGDPWPSGGGDLPPAAVIGPDPDPPNEDGPKEDPEPDEEPAPVEQRDTLRVTVTEFSQTRGIDLIVNGRGFHFPLGKPVTVPAWVLPSLAAVGGATFTVE